MFPQIIKKEAFHSGIGLKTQRGLRERYLLSVEQVSMTGIGVEHFI